MEFAVDGKIGNLQSLAFLVGLLADFDAIHSNIGFECTQQDGLCIERPDSLNGMLSKMKVHVTDTLFGSEDWPILDKVSGFFRCENIREGVIEVISKLRDIGGCLLGRSS